MPALDGLRILDMSQWEAGPSCTQSLALLGADVVKIEPPGSGDPGRILGDPEGGNSEYFVNWNCNKRSVAIDLRAPSGRELLLRMVPRYDVFVENYAPGVIEKLDLGYEVMRRLNPEIIYARVKGFGSSGPYSAYKCMDMVAQAAAGSLAVTGMADGPPVRPGFTIGDCGTGMQLALAITAAYAQRLKTGKGQLIELSMQEAVTYYMRTALALGSQWGRVAAPRTGNGVSPMVNLYPCDPGGPNDYAYIMIVNTRMWQNLCAAIGHREWLEDPRFARGAEREKHGRELYERISEWTRKHSKHEVMRIVGEAGVPCSAVLDTRDLFTDPHLRARGFVQQIDHPRWGTVDLLGWPARMSESEVALRAAPLLGEHTRDVLREDLELPDAELQALFDQGVLARE